MTLYERASQFRDVLDFDVADEDDADALIALLDEAEGAFDEKAKRVAYMIMQFGREAEVLREEEKRLAGRRKIRENKAERLRRYLQEMMQLAEINRVEDEAITIRLQKDAPSVRYLNETLIPREFWKTPDPVLDRKGVLTALKEGNEVSGVELVQTESVRIS